MSAVEDNLPMHTLESLSHYIIHGWAPGGFLESMLAMDMERALTTADVANRQRIWYIGNYIRTFMPEASWGSYEAVRDWSEDKDGCRTKWNVWNNLTRTHPPVQDMDF